MSIRLPLSVFFHKSQVQKLTVSAPEGCLRYPLFNKSFSHRKHWTFFPLDKLFPQLLAWSLPSHYRKWHMVFAPSLAVLSLSSSLFTAVIPLWLNLALGSEMLTHAWTMHAYTTETSLPGGLSRVPSHYLCAHTQLRVWHHLPLRQSPTINRDGRRWRSSTTKPPLLIT